MKVVVDATMLDGGPSGAATRLAALGAAHHKEGAAEVVHLVRPGVSPLPGLATHEVDGLDTPLRRARAGRRLDGVLAELGADLYHHGTLPVPAVRAVPRLLTLHDLRFLDGAAGQGLLRGLWGKHRLGPQLRAVDRVVAVSRTTAEELDTRRLVAPDRVAVVPNAGTPGLERVDEVQRIADFRARAGLRGRYVLALGPLEPHKRPEELLELLALVRGHADGADLALVLAGRADPRRALALARYAKRLGLGEVLAITGALPHDELAAALSGADALLCAGRHEGFALPVVDAQRLGVPVVAVASGALPEVGEDGAWFADPDDLPGLASALLHAVTPGDLREARLRRGHELAARWSWERSARELEGVWRAVLEEARG